MILSVNRPLLGVRLKLPLKWYQRLTVFTAFSVWMLIVLGGMVRVTGSGTGCGSSWPMCYGHLLPDLEYHQLVEWTHRLFATLVGVLMVVTIGTTLIWYRRPRRLMWMALLGGVTYVGQAVLGGITVLLHLDHTWVAAHMGNSMLLLASVILLATFSILGQVRVGETNRLLRGLSLGTLLWTYVALFTGSAVIGAQADLACAQWPQCSDNNILPANFEQFVNFGHRVAVGFSDVLLLLMGFVVWRFRKSNRRLMNMVHVLAVLYISQVFLGAFTIWLGAPSALKGAHLALAAATWGALVIMTTFVWIGKNKPEKQNRGSGGNFALQMESESVSRELVTSGAAANRASNLVQNVVQVKQVSRLKLYIGLMRPHVIPLLIVPTVCSMLIAAVQHPPKENLLLLILWTSLGGTLATGGAHAINQYLDRDLDAKMKRTKRRPVVTGLIKPRNALAFGVGLTFVAVIQLWITVNFLAALLALSGNFFYVFVYTIWLKRTTAQNIVIGGAAGAVPPLVGWAAVTGRIDLPALLFFAIIFFWTPAHFWALALVRHEEYEAAGVPMLPVVRGEAATLNSILYYALLLVVVTLVPFLLNTLSWLYLAAAVVLGAQFIRKAVVLKQKPSTARAYRLFKYSNTYLALLYLVMVADRLMALGGVFAS